MHDPLAGQRSSVFVPDRLRHAQELRWLNALAWDHLELDAHVGHLVLFASRRHDRIKILYWGVSRSK